MNGIYLIERTDEVGYDEYDSVVVIAPDEPTAIAKAIELDGDKEGAAFKRSFRRDGSNMRCREIIPSQEDVGVLLASFNAG